MSKHTPGPWHTHSNSNHEPPVNLVRTLTGADHYHGTYHAVVAADGTVICDNADYYPQALDPKNRHIVAAAPDLLEALNALIRASVFHGYEADSAVSVARAAIAKARGEA